MKKFTLVEEGEEDKWMVKLSKVKEEKPDVSLFVHSSKVI